MAKKARTAAAAEDQHRVAGPGRTVFAYTPRSAMAASMAATTAAAATVGISPAVAGAAAAVSASVFGMRFAGRTVGQWVALRRESRTPLEQAVLFANDKVGIVFDGTTATAFVEITPRPWQITSVGPTGENQSPVISADVLRRQLEQYDLRLSGIDVVCAGYKFASRDHASATLDTLIGPVSVPLGGVTVVAVSMALDAETIDPSYRRTQRGSLHVGFAQALTVAATRVMYSLAEKGFGGKLMDATRVRGFHDTVLAQVSRPLASPGWRNCGPRSGVHTRSYVPARGHWNAESAGAWNHLQSHRQYTSLSLSPVGGGQALAQPLITYLVRGSETFDKTSGFGLKSASGQQVAALERCLPVASRTTLRSPGAIIGERHRLGFGIPAGGAGLFVGSRPDKTRVFVASPPTEEPLWVFGPQLFALQMVARLSTQDRRIAVVIDDPAWEALVAHRAAPSLSIGVENLRMADVLVCTPAFWERNRARCEGKAIVLVAEDDPGTAAVNSMKVISHEGRSMIQVKVDSETTDVIWELTSAERRVLIGDVAAAGGVGDDQPTLPGMVSLPSPTKPRRVKRETAPAPRVRTVGQAAAPGEAPPPQAMPKKPRVAPKRDRGGPLSPPKTPVVTPKPAETPKPRAPRHARKERPAPPRVPVQKTVVQPKDNGKGGRNRGGGSDKGDRTG